MSLRRYHEKRDFARTREPKGAVRAGRERALSFVVQEHHARRLHWDFRLEWRGVLVSWAVPKGPSLVPGEKRLAVKVEDHPLEYGKFHGTIPKGEYGAGEVMIWDKGTWEPEGDPGKGLRAGRLKFGLKGKKLKGDWTLVRMGGRAAEEGKENWLLLKARDDEALPLTRKRPPSAVATSFGCRAPEGRASGSRARPRTMTPTFVAPQLATLVEAPPAGDGWIHETKFDGYRLECLVDGGHVRLLTRRGLDWTARFRPIATAAGELRAASAVLDGEVVVLDGRGLSSFAALQNALTLDDGSRLAYYAFDLLQLDGEDLTPLPLRERKERLKTLLEKSPRAIRYSDHISGQGEAFFEEACRRGLEGVVSKRAEAPYRSGRGSDWQKSKCSKRQEFVIGGFTEGEGSRKGAIGALLLGTHDAQGRLAYAGRVGTGFTAVSAKELWNRLGKIEWKESPFASPLPAADARRVRWVKPALVGEVSFTEWTRDGMLRHPSFQGLREDKMAKEVKRETEAAGATRRASDPTPFEGVPITNPDRVLFEEQGITKRDLAEYLVTVADRILPHVANRPLSLLRCPSGAGKECFYQKNANEVTPERIERIEIIQKSGVKTGMYIKDLAGLATLAQMGVLEIHPWGSPVGDIERPDRFTIDLDPGPGVEWKRVVLTARRVRERLEKLGLESFLKTTGGKGLHIVAPIRPATWERLSDFTRALAERMVADFPDDYVSKVSKAARVGKILVDWLRNTRGATAVAAYSTRAKPGATLSVPVTWDELSVKLRPDAWNVRTLPKRLAKLKKDPWAGFFDVRQSLPKPPER